MLSIVARARLGVLALALALIAAGGCGKKEAAPSATPSAAAAKAAPGGSAPVAIDVNALETYDLDGLRARIKGSGKKLTVVALWATWCAPCIEEMAGFDAFQKAHEKDGLEVVGLCTDDRADMAKKIQAVYDRTKVSYSQALLAPGGEDAFFKGLGEAWDGMLPKTVVFDAKGDKVLVFTAAVTPQMLDEQVLPLLSSN